MLAPFYSCMGGSDENSMRGEAYLGHILVIPSDLALETLDGPRKLKR